MPSDVEDEIKLNGDTLLTPDDYWHQTTWDPEPRDLGSQEPITDTEAVQLDRQGQDYYLQRGEQIPNSPSCLMGLYVLEREKASNQHKDPMQSTNVQCRQRSHYTRSATPKGTETANHTI